MLKRIINKLFEVVVATALSAMMCGCVFIGERYVFEEPFSEQELRSVSNDIRLGQVTKQDILRLFGPPMVIVIPGIRRLVRDVPAF